MAAGLSAFGEAERQFADRLSRAIARALPGNAALWRPVAHAAAFAGLAAGARWIAVKALTRIEHVQESVEAAFDFPPPNPLVSGSFESLVPFDTLSRAGRRFVWMVSSDRQDHRGHGRAGSRQAGARLRRPRERAENEQERVDLALRELERTGAFDRSWLMVASPTGTGYVNYAAASILEFLTRGDCATVAMQYSARPSPLSLDRVKRGPAPHADAVQGDRRAVRAVSRRRAAEGRAVRREPRRVDEPGPVRRSGHAGPRRRRHRLRDLDRHPALQQVEGAGRSSTTAPTSTARSSAASTTSRSGRRSSRASANASAT